MRQASTSSLASEQLGGAIRGAHERRRRDLEAEVGSATLVLSELLGRDVAGHGQAAGLGLQVLADGDHVDRGRGAVGEHRRDLSGRLAEADHETALDERPGEGGSVGARVARPGRRPPQELQRAFVVGLWPHLGVEARHRLEVVIEHVRTGGENDRERRLVAAQVGDQHLDGGRRQLRAHGFDGGGEMAGPAVGEVVAGDARDDDVAQAQAPGRLRDAARLVGVDGARAGRARRSAPHRSGSRGCRSRRG